MNEPPLDDGLYRGVAITQALARLGERGIKPDWLVRVCIAPQLLRRMMMRAVVEWHLSSEGNQNSSSLVPSSWVSMIEEDIALLKVNRSDLAGVLAASLQGETYRKAKEWIQNASMTHIIGWKIENYYESKSTVEDESIAGGQSAGLWIYDRFSKTYISEWDKSSLLWELAFLNDPEAVAEQVEISLNVLKEREVSYLQIIEASLSVASRAEFSGIFGNKVVRGVLADDVAEIIYEALVSHQYDLAVSLAKSMWEQEPDNGLLKSIYAFVILPRDPNLAKEIFQSEEVSKVLERGILKIDLACCHLAMNDVATAQQSLKETRGTEGREVQGCFWLPESLLKGEPQVAIISTAKWGILLDRL